MEMSTSKDGLCNVIFIIPGESVSAGIMQLTGGVVAYLGKDNFYNRLPHVAMKMHVLLSTIDSMHRESTCHGPRQPRTIGCRVDS